MIHKLGIFPYKANFLGLVMIIFSLPFGYLYYWGGRPEIFNIKVFAIITNYLETRYFVVAQTNILDELAAILLILGIALISFSKRKNEKAYYEELRMKALIKAVYITLAIWILSFLFIYGMAIVLFSLSIFLFFLLLYNAFFQLYLQKAKKIALKS